MSKRAQSWGFDLLIGASIFLTGVLFFYVYVYSLSGGQVSKLDTFTNDGNKVANALLSSGSPENWNEGNVQKIGILSDGKINDTKLQEFYSFSISNYEKTKVLFNVNFDYYISFNDPIDAGNGQVLGIGREPVNPENLIKVTRVVIYNEKPETLNVIIWE